MNFKLTMLSFSISSALLLGACSVTPFNNEEMEKPLQVSATPLVVERSASYLREVTPDELLLSRKINVTGRLTLIDAIRKQVNGVNIVPGDSNVELNQEVLIYAQEMTLADYFSYLESITGYDIEYKQNVVTVRSFVHRQWNLASFASKRNVRLSVGSTFNFKNTSVSDGASTTTTSNDNKLSTAFDEDEWKLMIESAESILGVKDKNGKAKDQKELQKPFVQSIRSLGLINVGGSAARVKVLDKFYTNMIEHGSKQVNINVQAYDVSLDDSRGAGIDWTKLANVGGSINGNPLDISINSIDPTKSFINEGALFQSNVHYTSSSIDANAMIRFLSQYGEVELLNQPNVTVRNGSYAYISTGDELTFVGEVETKENTDGSDKKTVTLQSVRVGVTLAVTPRILSDGRVMLDIWPVISSKTGDFVFEDTKVPIIALNELSTEVITESGKPIQLGGFISKELSKKLQDLPWKDRITQTLVNPLFKTESNTLGRRELVLTVTPTIVEDV